MARKAATVATPHLTIKHYKDSAGVEHIEVEQTVAGNKLAERRVLDYSQKSIDSQLVGALVQRNRRVAVGELGMEWLKQGWLAESLVDGAVIHVTADSDAAKSETKWHMEQVSLGLDLRRRCWEEQMLMTGVQVWGFQLVDGQKKYVRRIHSIGQKGEVVHGCLVYDYGKSFGLE